MSDRDEASHRLRRLRIRSWRRGTREMDLILGRFADTGLDALAPAELEVFDSLLSENDHDLYLWIAGRESSPEGYREILARIRSGFGLR